MARTTLDPYATLGIGVNASRADAARAHRRLAKANHPDLNPGPAAAERMRQINEAWRILSNPARRERYDADRRAGSWGGPTTHAASGTATWTTWPESRRPARPRARRPARPEPAAPSFGDRRAVVFVVWAGLAALYFVGAWLGSLSP